MNSACIDFKSLEESSSLKTIISNEINNFFLLNNTLEKDIKKNLDHTNLVNIVFIVLSIFSEKPLSDYEQISKKTSIQDKKVLASIFKLIRSIPTFQEIILKKGQGTKYWTNIIVPLLKSKSVENFIKKKYSFPFRVGLFPGVSCMFECSFCGRNYNAVYKKDFAQKGIDIFKKIIDESPAVDSSRFFLSGGLEPLTNPFLSEIIDYLKLKKFKASLYTNGYMLTEKYLKKNPSIFLLDSLRISFYGINDDETFLVTKKKRAFEIVTNNIVNYLKIKNNNNCQTSFGLNFVILKDRSSDIVELFKLISQINRSVGNNKNNFDFITLREDFRILGNRMDTQEKNKLIENIKTIEQMKNEDKYLQGIHIDYGFALEPIKNGFSGNTIESNFASFEELKILAMPQGRVVVDLYGDVFLFGEAGFLDRPGATKYILGNVFEKQSMKKIIEDFILNPPIINFHEEDRDFLDAWDHIAVKLSSQQISNEKFGIGLDKGIIDIDNIDAILNSNHKVHFSS